MTTRKPLKQSEFVALMAALFAAIAFAIDAMLPALPDIAAALTPGSPNRAQLILTSFVLGMGLGTFVAGPISDSAGRKITIIAAFALYILGALLAYAAPTLETLLAARFLQGLGAAGPRIVSIAMVRDLYAGRKMAQIMSLVMMIFLLVPAVAPYIGSLIIDAFGWRAIFLSFVGMALTGGLWLSLRQPETLPPERRAPFRPSVLRAAFVEALSNRKVVLYTAVLTLGFGQMFALLSTIHPIYADSYGLADSFPFYFLVTGLVSAIGTILNAALVMRVGMRRIALVTYALQAAVSAGLVLWALSLGDSALLPFWAFFVWTVSVFAMAGLTFGNLNALALEPMGHIAGMASSVIGAVSTVISVAIAVPVGLAFNGTPQPLLIGTLICSALAAFLMTRDLPGVPDHGSPAGGSDPA